MRPPNALPTFDCSAKTLEDGGVVKACAFCRQRLVANDKACLKNYEQMARMKGIFRMCPYGFTSYAVSYKGEDLVLTGAVAAPRFGDPKEMARSKQFPDSRVSRGFFLAAANFYKQVDTALAELEGDSRKRLPQALHELRKLNAIVKANAEKLGGNDAEVQEVRDISGSAELMSNIFDVVEALANIDGLKLLKRDDFIAVYDLAFKAKKIYQIRAKIKPIHISVSGDPAVGISGSKKIFPIVLTVLLENAIKYGKVGSAIDMRVGMEGSNCLLEVSNRSDSPIESTKCFERGARFGDRSIEGDGLGLYLAREIVVVHQGTIECRKEGDLVTIRVLVPAHSAKKRGFK